MFTDSEQVVKCQIGLALPSDIVFDLQETSEEKVIDWLKQHNAPADVVELASLIPIIYLYAVKSAENSLNEKQAGHLCETFLEVKNLLTNMENTPAF